jgi:hypothetical protein
MVAVLDSLIADDLAAIAKIDAVPKILEVVCRTTGMGFAAVARVTKDRWVACAVRDQIAFGLQSGGELQVKTTIDVASTPDPLHFPHAGAAGGVTRRGDARQPTGIIHLWRSSLSPYWIAWIAS